MKTKQKKPSAYIQFDSLPHFFIILFYNVTLVNPERLTEWFFQEPLNRGVEKDKDFHFHVDYALKGFGFNSKRQAVYKKIARRLSPNVSFKHGLLWCLHLASAERPLSEQRLSVGRTVPWGWKSKGIGCWESEMVNCVGVIQRSSLSMNTSLSNFTACVSYFRDSPNKTSTRKVNCSLSEYQRQNSPSVVCLDCRLWDWMMLFFWDELKIKGLRNVHD